MEGVGCKQSSSIYLYMKIKSQFRSATTTLFFYVICFLAKGQIATYSFENSIDDNNDVYTSAYQLTGVETALDNSIFVTGINGTGVELAPRESIRLPLELSQAIVAGNSFEIKLDLRYLDDGNPEGDGVKSIFTLKTNTGDGSPGFTLRAQKDFSNPGFFSLTLLYADGWGESRGSLPSFNNRFGSFPVGEWLEITIIFDFAQNVIITSAGDAYTQQPFNPNFDIDRFKTDMGNMNAFFGWLPGLESVFDRNPNELTATVVIDEVEIYSPRKPASTAVLVQELNKMTNHVNGTVPMNEEDLRTSSRLVNANYLGQYFNAKNAFDQYIQAFEAANPPMFSGNGQLIDVPNASPEFFIAFQLQQEIFDNGFVPGRMGEMAGMQFEAHENWPGRVAAEAPRLDNQLVEINGTYTLDPGYILLDEGGGVRRPTGYYAAPGELINVTVDPSWVNQGVKVYIGGHSNNLASKLDRTNRFVRVSKEVDITQQTTPIANPFGGSVFFRFPPNSSLGWGTVEIDGAVKAPFYRNIPGHETSVSDFNAAVNSGHVQWMDIESEYWMMTLPINMLGNRDVSAILAAWDEMWRAVLVASGRPLTKNRSEYMMFDRRGAVEGLGAGYPMAFGLDVTPYNANDGLGDNPLRILDSDWLQRSGNGNIVHEMGHNMRFPTLGNELETIVQLVGVPAYNVGLNHPLDSAWKYVENENHTSDLAAINWMIAQNFRDNNDMGCDPTIPGRGCNELQYQMRGFGKYVEVARLFGWEGLGSVFKYFYDFWAAGGPRQTPGREFVGKADMITAMNTGLGVNVNPLLHFWGLIPDEAQRTQYASLPASREIYYRLLYYRDLVPRTQAEFQPWYDRLYSSVDFVHHIRLDYALNNYDSENLGQRIVDQINFILTTYYGNDNDNDGYSIIDECDDFNASVNPGMTEIPYNGIDDDCNPATPDDDLDQDGFVLANDCDDDDPLVMSGPEEIPFNGLDDDCNKATTDGVIESGQIAAYSFANSIDENAGNFLSRYYFLDVPKSLDNQIFAPGLSGTGVTLGPSDGVQLPSELSALLVSEESFEIDLNFNYIDDGGTEGIKPVFSMKTNTGEGTPGFMIESARDFIDVTRIRLYFLYSDGVGHVYTRDLGSFEANAWVNLILGFDFPNRRIIVSDGSRTFDERIPADFNVVAFQQSMASLPAFFGWINGLGNAIVRENSIHTSTIQYDEVRFFSPARFNQDVDRDGFAAIDDCDDTNAAINSGAIEIPYNGIDDDCNPNTPDDDLDQDGFIAANDCDDNNAAVNSDQPEIPYNGLDDDCDPLTLDDDLDQDGFIAANDCDDTDADVNSSQPEIPYNGIDDDCDPNTPDDDLDQDGFIAANDCDDNNAAVNSGQTEIPYNGIDDDCDPNTPDDDLDQDGFIAVNDCDDTNADVNSDQTEILYNGLDDDCDPSTLDDDLDQDGFIAANDCDDENASINPATDEIPYNGIDDDCDPSTLDDDLDQDGFTSAGDCDDTNASINPEAVDIPGNGIDENCDGLDLILSADIEKEITLYPNPATDFVTIDNGSTKVERIAITDFSGRIIYTNDRVNAIVYRIDLSSLEEGIYLMSVISDKSRDTYKIMVKR